MRDTLPEKVKKFECGIVNLDSIMGSGTHWICYYKNDKNACYFDSYGRIEDKPPIELIKYLKKSSVYYNDSQIQDYKDPPICGHLCVFVLNELSTGKDFKEVVNKLLLNKYGFTKYF
ncbi:MAG: hypothetical protein KFE23_00350 [Candidatus Baumannia cicadellinicola]|nr:hypothetical protein [Candidatus Baumannia cicadellinicola]